MRDNRPWWSQEGVEPRRSQWEEGAHTPGPAPGRNWPLALAHSLRLQWALDDGLMRAMARS